MSNNDTAYKGQHVLMLVGTHVYDDARVLPESNSLIDAGYKVSVIGIARYGGLPVKAVKDNVNILIAPMITTFNPLVLLKEFWRLVICKLGTITQSPTTSYRTSNIISIIFFTFWMIRLGWKTKVDVVHCHDFLQLPASWILARHHRAKWIYDARESAPHTYALYSQGKIATQTEQFLVPKVDAVIAVGELVGKDLKSRGAKNITVIGNWKNLDEYEIDPVRLEKERARLALDDYNLTISYLGSLGHGRNLETLLETIMQTPNIMLLVSGQGPLEKSFIEAAQQYSNIIWLGWLNKEDVALYTMLADAVYCSIAQDYYQADYVVPNKLFESFAAGKPIIAVRGVGEMSEILDEFPSAIFLDEISPITLNHAFQDLQQPQIRNQLQIQACKARDRYNWSVAETLLLHVYNDL